MLNEAKLTSQLTFNNIILTTSFDIDSKDNSQQQ